MADDQEKTAEELYPDDTVAQQLHDQVVSNKALVQGLKYEYGQALLDAQGGQGETPSEFSLLQIKRLETQILNDELYLEARTLTRRPEAAVDE